MLLPQMHKYVSTQVDKQTVKTVRGSLHAKYARGIRLALYWLPQLSPYLRRILFDALAFT